MLTPERYRAIMELLEAKKVVKLQEIIDVTAASESTIRRDLSSLEKGRKLKRVHGGAALLQQKGEEPSISEKATKSLQEKEEIAAYAATLIHDGDCIYLDAGTTVYQLIKFIQAKGIKVVTNGLTHLEVLLEQGIDTYVVGGFVKPKTRALIGSGAIETIEGFRFDKSFIGVNGIHEMYGFTTPDPEEAKVKKTVMNMSQATYVLADHTKFQEVTFARIADINQATIITNQLEEYLQTALSSKTTIKVVTS
ncbi:DeoR/GlpR family DNA-binding transcription regulator [Bacillus horti]|uniref:DeoR family fructose operon transcriptional repressor n=1 Tax=Caldalkalibacillus horti TaxID=77523 RepID=A0ABT9W3K8_9BACI|nr:DeoR/GlpR family DNA-binding transcription regulator [Bacillus horti]MDQ0167657.1 DeoR family fructose operon transcriptional repressor [Bacillus horti]